MTDCWIEGPWSCGDNLSIGTNMPWDGTGYHIWGNGVGHFNPITLDNVNAAAICIAHSANPTTIGKTFKINTGESICLCRYNTIKGTRLLS
jgi:hypothetical protein